MRKFLVIACLVSLCGCAHKRGVARVDAFESARVAQMSGNNVHSTAFSKTILCLDARCETRRVTVVTNQVVAWSTNRTVTWLTNLTSTSSTNTLNTLATNQLPP